MFAPGILTWDAIRQYRQALSGRYDDWHPPAMSWLWRQVLPLHAGPLPMLMLQVALYWIGFALLALAALRRGRSGAAIALIAAALLPIPLVLIGTVLKDSLMAGTLLVAAGLIAVRRDGDRLLTGLAAALLIGAATLRLNAVPACLPLALALAPRRWRRTPGQVAFVTAIAAVLLGAALPLANRSLRAERSGVALSLVIYDLAGVGYYAHGDAFPPLPVRDPVAINAACYTPISWDAYAWWGPSPCPIQFADVREAFAQAQASPYAWWASAIVHHPVAYARHRLAHFRRSLRLAVRSEPLPPLPLVSDPNPWGFEMAPDRARPAIGAAARWMLGTPLGWPASWLAIAGLATAALARSKATGAALPIGTSALLYGLSYLPLSVASEVRYYLWVTIGAAIAAIGAVDGALLRWAERSGRFGFLHLDRT